MEWLAHHGYHAVSQLQAFEALEYGKALPSKPEMITFDDGHHDVLWHAPGLLHSLHMPATAYIDSKRTLEQHLGHPVQWFAYPDGRENPAVVALALKAGSVVAVTTQPGSTQSAQAPLTLHRYEVLDTTGVDGVADFVRGS